MNELSVIIPCTQSVKTIPQFIDRLAVHLMANPGDTDIIVVANEKAGPVLPVMSYVKQRYPWLRFEVLQRKGGIRSYGALVRFGLAYSSSSYAVLVSPHGNDDIRLIPAMLSEMRKGRQLAQAVRYSGKTPGKNIPLRFRVYQSVFRRLTWCALGYRLNDSTYGFKMFDRVFIQSLGLNQNGYSLSPEITFKSLLAGGKVAYLSSTSQTAPINSDFRLYSEGIGYLWLLYRGLMHRLGVLWF